MKNLSKTALAIAAAAAVIATVPGMASARDYRDNDRGRWDNHDRGNFGASRQIDARIQNLDMRIDQGVRTRGISRAEASRLNSRLHSIVSLKRQYERSGRGLSDSEVRTLNNRLDQLSGSIRYQRHDGNRR